MTLHRSYSQVNQLRSCGWQYKLQRIDGLPSRPSCPAVAGKIFHSASELIDKAIHDGKLLDHDGLIDREAIVELARWEVREAAPRQIAEDSVHYAVDEWKKYGKATTEKPNGEDMSWFLSVGIPNMIDAYVAWRFDHLDWKLAEIPGFGPAIEVPFSYVLDGVLIHGFIDRVFVIDGHLCPVDLKSGRQPKTDEQLGLYGAALHDGLGWEPGWGYYIYGLKLGTAKLTPPLDLRHWTPEKLGQVYGTATKAIQNNIFLPHPGDNCFVCGFTDSCAFAQAVV